MGTPMGSCEQPPSPRPALSLVQHEGVSICKDARCPPREQACPLPNWESAGSWVSSWLVLFEVPRNVSGFPAMCLGISGGEKEEEGLVRPSVYSLGSGNRGLLWGFLQTFVCYY